MEKLRRSTSLRVLTHNKREVLLNNFDVLVQASLSERNKKLSTWLVCSTRKKDFKAFQIQFFSVSVRYCWRFCRSSVSCETEQEITGYLDIALCMLVQNHYISAFVHFLGQLSRELSSTQKADKFFFRDKVRQDNKTDWWYNQPISLISLHGHSETVFW